MQPIYISEVTDSDTLILAVTVQEKILEYYFKKKKMVGKFTDFLLQLNFEQHSLHCKKRKEKTTDSTLHRLQKLILQM